jgi:hypothetical protein
MKLFDTNGEIVEILLNTWMNLWNATFELQLYYEPWECHKFQDTPASALILQDPSILACVFSGYRRVRNVQTCLIRYLLAYMNYLGRMGL